MRRPLLMVCLCLVAMAALRLWYDNSSDAGESGEALWQPADGDIITVSGRVYQKDTQSFTIDSVISNAADPRQNIPFNENLICEYSESPRIGSLVTLRGTFQSFSEATNPGEFDVAEYYHTMGIGGKLTDITVLENGEEYSVWRETLWQLRTYFRNRLYTVFPQKEASVLTAMLLGDKEDLDSGVKELYKENGIIHILSISGLHITMIGMSIYQMLRRAGVPVWLAAICGGSILCLYGVMTGLSVSACRAIGMYLIRMLGQVLGRTYDMLTALGVMAAVMVWQNPMNLNNAGFLLSFGSILGIGWLYPAILPEEKPVTKQRYEPRKWKRVFGRVRREWRKRLTQSIAASSSITLFTLPIQLWFYYEVPVYSIFVNLLILPFMSLLMMTGLVVMILPGTGVIGTITCLILKSYECLCECFEGLPFHTWNPGKPEAWQVIVYYFSLFILILSKEWRHRVQKQKDRRLYQIVMHVGIPMALTIAVTILTWRIPTTSVTFLDVGQGECIIVELKSGEVFLFDCGSTSRGKVGQYVLLPYLKYQGIQQIDAAFISHGDADHCSGIKELLALEEESILFKQLILPQIAEEIRAEEFAEVIGGAKGLVSYIGAGESFSTKTATFLCLHPPKEYMTEDSNAYSQCLYVRIEDFSLLLTGDIQGVGEELLVQEVRKRDISDVTVLKVAHHGSRNSTSEEFLAEVSPQVAIISCGKDNSYGHPHKETLERLKDVKSRIFSTSDCGAITIEVDGEMKISFPKTIGGSRFGYN